MKTHQSKAEPVLSQSSGVAAPFKQTHFGSFCPIQIASDLHLTSSHTSGSNFSR